MSLKAIARDAVREASGDPEVALDRFMAAIDTQVATGADFTALFAEIHGVMKDAPHMVAAAEETLALATGDKHLAEAILRERLDPRENPEFTAEAKSEMLKALAPALVKILSAELEAYGRDPEK